MRQQIRPGAGIMHRNEVEMIIGKDVCKGFEGFKALDNASFHVKKARYMDWWDQTVPVNQHSLEI